MWQATTSDGYTESFLRSEEQDDIKCKIARLINQAPKHEVLFLRFGTKVCFIASLLSSIVLWRSSYRAYGLAKYNVFPKSGIFFSLVGAFQGACIHDVYIAGKNSENFSDESPIHYGLKSMLVHQFSGLSIFFYAVTPSIIGAIDYNTIILPPKFLSKVNRAQSLRILGQRLKPYSKRILGAHLICSGFMFYVGFRERYERNQILAKMGRKTLSLREDQCDMLQV